MKLSVFATALLGAEAVLAARFTEQRRARNADRFAARAGSARLPTNDADNAELFEADASNNDTARIAYSTNWAGAVLMGTGFKSVTGTFVVPTPSVPSGGSSGKQYAASAWVGIDGATAPVILQTGVDFFVEAGKVHFDAWYEWFPDYAYDFSGISISAGDTITVTCIVTSAHTGTAIVKNVSKGTTVTHTFGKQDVALKQVNAEWIVEDFGLGDGLVPFADFGTVTFADATADTASGTVTPEGAEINEIKQNNKVMTSSSVSGSTVKVSYL